MPPKRKAMADTSADSLNSRSNHPNKRANHHKAQSTTPASSKETEPLKEYEPSGTTKPSYDGMGLPELKDELRKRRLKISGSKGDLIKRLNQNDHERSLPVKQAIEAAARKRREKNPPPQEDDSDAQFDRDMIRENKVLRNGPTGNPVFDDWGYELSYDKLSGSRTTMNKRTMLDRQWKYFERMEAEDEQKRQIMFGEAQPKEMLDSRAMDWQVSQDLEIPMHKVEVCDYEVWREMGFKAEKKDFVEGQVDPEVEKKIDAQEMGSDFRK
ncbi:uncharacterized protein BDZ99DRAFT_460087 [Mytilinidion resinicola]|uniref:SAP domain-containing protein n=1 Tax=Mytilinidion resinicola TaxID=574789 RepID=A0A6A6Z145_9PEZI|nr:uncharacterized protein BDZ99DRAFT_460087 [Mytilinidion resinicola]KAF2814439.1 hypothetical protein BDZ99DRAFT_460087 [Mytilinidion resinicola]